MTTFNTGNPIGSTDARDRLDNSENMDILENSTTLNEHPDRLGVMRKTRKGMELEHDNQIAAHEAEFIDRILKMTFTPSGTFTAGATLFDARQTLLWEVSQGGDGHYYSWSGTFPKVVAAGSAPSPIEAGSWVDRTDDALRYEIRETVFQNMKHQAAEAGFNLVDGSFEEGANVTGWPDVIWCQTDGKYYQWHLDEAKTIPAGSTPATSGGLSSTAWVDRTDLMLRGQLSSKDGAGLIGEISYSQLRAYSGVQTTVNVWGIFSQFDGAAGVFKVNPADTTSSDNGGTILVDAIGRRWYRIFDREVSVKWFGAVGNGVVDDTAAVSAALATGYRVLIPYGVTVTISPSSTVSGALLIEGTLLVKTTCTISADVTITATGKFNAASGITVLFTGMFTAPLRRVFIGSGTIYGIHETWPEWWGAAYGVDSAAALEAAFNCIKGAGVSRNYVRGVLHVNAMGIARQVTLTMSTFVHVDIVGGGNNLNGGDISLMNGFSGWIGVLVQGDSTNNIASFSINQIALRNTSGAIVTVGWQFDNLSGITQNSVSHTTAHGFGYNFKVTNSRLVDFDNCAGWKGSAAQSNGIFFTTSGAVSGTFVGDCKITKCQFETAGYGASIVVEVSIRGHQCKGLHIDATALYKSDTGSQFIASATNGGIIGDIFFSESCQFDGFTKSFFSIAADGAGSIVDDIIFNGTYFRGSSAANAMNVVASNSGQVSTVRLLGCYIANALAPVANFSACYGIVLSACNFYDTTGSTTTTAIVFASCNRFVCSDNIVSRSGGGYFATFIGISGASDYYTVTNNIAGGIVSTSVISDSGSGTHKTITGNI